MSWNLAWLLALLLEIGDPTFDPELACAEPRLAASPLCLAGPWAELLPGPAALRARLLFAMAALHEALGDETAAGKARAAADEALELALTDRAYANGWLSDARAALERARAGSGPRVPGDEPPGGEWSDGTSPAAERAQLATARDGLRRP
jgi:hypothetical protein